MTGSGREKKKQPASINRPEPMSTLMVCGPGQLTYLLGFGYLSDERFG